MTRRDQRKADTTAPSRFAGLAYHTLNETEQADVVRLALELLASRHARGQPLSSPAETRRYLQVALAEHKNEVFAALFLDNRHRVLAFEVLFLGTIDGTAVYPRVVVAKALAHNAAAVIFVHNHPSGVAEPSRADELLTHRLKDALALVDIRVLDHIVVSGETTVSLAERGVI